jgi:hypothetical protein
MRRFIRIVLTVVVYLSMLVSNVSQAVLPGQPSNPPSDPPQNQPAPPAPALHTLPISNPAPRTVPVSNPVPAASINTTRALTVTDPRNLPAELAGVQELTDKRTANSATFKNGDQYTSIIAAQSMHYLDEIGKWQVINPAFVATEKGYVVERNSIHSRVGQFTPSVAASAGQTVVNWRATELGVARGDDFVPLAHALTDITTPPQKKDNGRTLSYTGSWSDAQVVEEVTSAPDALEQSLIVAAPPAVSLASGGEWLELRASLKLLPNTVVWANGKAQSSEFATQGAIELRDSQGNVSLAFDPVRAFEQAHPEIEVAGEYVVRPVPVGDVKGQEWSLSLRTPLAWWTDPARSYPSVIDPKMRVLQTTATPGGGNTGGMAWVADGNCTPSPLGWGLCDATDKKLNVGDIVLGQGPGEQQHLGYLQFNQMPYLLTTHPYSVSQATLEIEPSGVNGVGFTYDDSHPDWYMYNNAIVVGLTYLSKCPGGAGCYGFALTTTTNLSNFYWGHTPIGSNEPSINTLGGVLYTPVLKTNPEGGQPKGHTVATDFDVTTYIQNWVGKSPRPVEGPLFMLQEVAGFPCSYLGDHKEDNGEVGFDLDHNFQALACMRLHIQPADVRLIIKYDPLTLYVGQAKLNSPGMPSYNPGIFDDGDKGNITHQYALAPQGAADLHWRAVAVKPNQALYATALPGQVGLRLSKSGAELGRADPAGVDNATEWALIDDHNTSAINATATLNADVTPVQSDPLYYPTDGGRNYRIEYEAGMTVAVPYSKTIVETFYYESDRLIELRELSLLAGDSFQISVTIPLTLTADVALAIPTAGTDAPGRAVRAPRPGDDNGLLMSDAFIPYKDANNLHLARTLPYLDASGDYALAFINHGRPTVNPDRLSAQSFLITVQMLRCPVGAVPTARWDCQPVIVPHPAQNGHPATITRTLSTLGGLTVYSEGGFTGSSNNWCTTNEGAGAPIIGAGVENRWTAVGQGSVCWDGQTLSTTPDSGVMLITATQILTDGLRHGYGPQGFSYGDTTIYPWPAGMTNTGVLTRTTLSPADQLLPTRDTFRGIDPFHTYWSSVRKHGTDYISTADNQMHGTDTISVPVSIVSSSAPTRTQWTVTWWIYPDEASDPIHRYTFRYNDPQSPRWPAPINMASMELRLLDLVTGTAKILDYSKFCGVGPRVEQFRAASARITQPAQLGAASKSVEAIVLPPGSSRYSLDGLNSNCGADKSCLDLYDGTYQWLDVVVPWVLPDVHVTKNAGSVIVSRPGQVTIYSKDHPGLKQGPASATDDSQEFSFDTYGVQVSVKEEACESGGPPVTVIHGEGKIALPMLGDDGSGNGTGVSVKFKICETALHDAQLTLSISPPVPDVPIGATGLGVNLVQGGILVNSQHTVVSFTVGFESLDRALLTGGYGTVTIDTLGMFDLKAEATIIAVIDAQVELMVAWNPLDVLIDAEASVCGGLIEGALKLEGWVGQGWQHKYYWLPNDDSFHFDGSIEAKLQIPKDYISDFLDIPPSTFVIAAIKISFGDFCDNDTCSQTTAGMSVVITIIGIDIGLYIDKHGPAFIFGSDDHVLANEYQSSSALAQELLSPELLTATLPITLPGARQPLLGPKWKSSADDWEPLTYDPCSAQGNIRTCPFTVTASAGRAMFIAQWQNGRLDASLIRPDNQVITSSNAAAFGVTFSQTLRLGLRQMSYAVMPVSNTQIMTGVWKLQLSRVGLNLKPDISNNYKLMFFTDPAPPQLNWIAPTQTLTVTSGTTVTLQWNAFRPGRPLTSSTKLELFYTPVVSKPVDPGQMAGLPIVGRYTATLGTYGWNTSGLASGAYAFGARIDDHLNANGTPVFWSPGVVVITDTTPPPQPVIFGTTAVTDGLILTWQCDSTPDLASYLVVYRIPDWDLNAPQLVRWRRVLPHACSLDSFGNPTPLPAEHVRLGGFNNGVHVSQPLCVYAYDASGNASTPACAIDVSTIPHQLIGAPSAFNAYPAAVPVPPFGISGPAIRAAWDPPSDGPSAAGYLLSYTPTGCPVPSVDRTAAQGLSPIVVGNVLSYTLTGLALGQVYYVSVAAYDGKYVLGPEVGKAAMYMSPIDSNADGIPDMWATLYGATSPSADPDRDGLTNLQEYQHATDPNNSDSDGDGFYDGKEVNAGTSPCGPEHPPLTFPKLTLTGKSSMTFQSAINQMTSVWQTLYIYNFGGGTMGWTATPSASWIVLDQTQGTGDSLVKVGVNPAGLAPGVYTGQVTISGFEAGSANMSAMSVSDAVTETATIDVQFEVLPAQQFDLFLPLVMR